MPVTQLGSCVPSCASLALQKPLDLFPLRFSPPHCRSPARPAYPTLHCTPPHPLCPYLLPPTPTVQLFLYPIALVVVAVPLAILAGINPTKLALRLWFDYK